MSHDHEPAGANNNARRWALLRLAAYLVVLCAVLALFSARAAYAELERSVLGLGQKLVSELGPTLVSDPQAVVLNGQPLFLGATTSPLTVSEVLDAFADNCLAGTRDMQSLLHTGVTVMPTQERLHRGWLRALEQARVLRLEDDAEGMLSCLSPSHAQRDVAGLVDGLRAFMESGDLSQLGDVRYVTARRLPSGSTQVIAVWTEGPFHLASIFPDRGDAPGSDMPDVPRPPESVRALSATAPHRSFSYRLYESARPAPEVLAFYERTLVQGGWSKVHTVDEPANAAPSLTIQAFSRRGRALGIGVELDEQGTTQISLVDMGQVAHVDAIAAP